MTRRGTRLLERDPGRIGRILAHPLQRSAVARITELLGQLRQLDEPADYYEFQRYLFADEVDAQMVAAEATRNVKRLRRGRSVPDTPSGDWELEQAVADRVVRQFRAVGDALAWRLFGFDRRYLIALSRNAPVSPLIGKEGLDYELGAVTQMWNEDRCFALLHDLTSSVRISDLTAFTPEGLKLVEVKKHKAGHSREQTNRAQRAVAVLNEGAPLVQQDEEIAVVGVDVELQTHLGELGKCLDAAARDGVASVSPEKGWVVSCIDFQASLQAGNPEEVVRSWNATRDRRFAETGLARATHHLRGVRVDHLIDDPAAAPLTIFPFAPGVCAKLTADWTTYESVLSWDRLRHVFDAAGFETEFLLPNASDWPSSTTPVCRLRWGSTLLTMHANGLNQILFELVTLARYVSAVRDLLAKHRTSAGSGVITFAGEEHVWG